MSLVGNLEDLPLTDIFQIVSLSKRTGVLNIASETERASITFMNGNVIKCSSTQNKEPLGFLLKQKGWITDEQEAFVLREQEETREPFGTVLVRKNIVSKEKMERFLEKYIQTIIIDLISWEEGTFDFNLLSSAKDVFPLNGSDLVLDRGMDTQHLIIEGLRLLDEKRHREGQSENCEKNTMGFTGLIEEAPVSLTPSQPADIEDPAGQAEELWMSIEDELKVPEAGDHPTAVRHDPPPPSSEWPENEDEGFLDEIECIEPPVEKEGGRRKPGEKGDGQASPNMLSDLVSEVEDEIEISAENSLPREISGLRSMIEELREPNSLSEVLLLLLRYASDFVTRSILFVVNEKEIRGFGQFGLDRQDRAANERVRDMSFPEQNDAILGDALAQGCNIRRKLNPDSRWDQYLIENLGGQVPEESVVIPLLSNKRPIALLYGDNGPGSGRIEGIDALEIFAMQAGVVLDRSFLERRLEDIKSG